MIFQKIILSEPMIFFGKYDHSFGNHRFGLEESMISHLGSFSPEGGELSQLGHIMTICAIWSGKFSTPNRGFENFPLQIGGSNWKPLFGVENFPIQTGGSKLAPCLEFCRTPYLEWNPNIWSGKFSNPSRGFEFEPPIWSGNTLFGLEIFSNPLLGVEKFTLISSSRYFAQS